MGEISEMRGLIVVFVVVATTITLITAIPSEFYEPTLSNPQIGNANPIDVIAWNSTYTLNLTYSESFSVSQDFTLNDYNYGVTVYPSADIGLFTYEKWWLFEWGRDDFYWHDSNGTEVSETTSYVFEYRVIAASTIDEYIAPQKFSCTNSKTSIIVTVVYNTTEYLTFTDALKDDAAAIIFNVDWNERNTSINALTLISMLFTASLPNVDPTLNLLLTFALWACIAYLIFIFALRVVGAVFGGGGA